MIKLEPTAGGIIQPNDTWQIHDATKLQTYLDCPRKYFYQFVLGWRPDKPAIHLIFGEAWHRAMAHLLEFGYKEIDGAFQKFKDYYSELIGTNMEEVFAPKNPAGALAALIEYSQRYAQDEFQVKHLEVPARVTIDDERIVHARLDAIIVDKDGKTKVLEHKTASTFGFNWAESWSLKIQIGMYTHVLACLYDPSELGGVIVNGTAFMKKGNDFLRVPVNKSMDMMETWLWNVQQEVKQIELQFAALEECRDSDGTMRSFPMNTESCTKYGGCPFHDYCSTWANPLRRCDSPPIGWKQEFWNPEDRVEGKEELAL